MTSDERHKGWTNRDAGAAALEDFVRSVVFVTGMIAELVNCALARVNWREVSKALRDTN